MKMSRRNLIVGSIAMSFTTPHTAAVASVDAKDSGRTARLVEKTLFYYFDDETAAHTAIKDFADAFAESSDVFDSQLSGRFATLLAPLPYALFRRAFLLREGDTLENRVRKFESDILTTFLLSTDYFSSNDPDKNQHNFEQVYNPYDSACQNPLAKTLA